MLGLYPNQKVLDCVFRIFPQLTLVPMQHYNRKFMFEGVGKSGKTKLISELHEKIVPKYDPTLVKVAGFKTGDTRYFNYNFAKYQKKEDVTPFQFFKEGGVEENYGIFTFDGKKQAKGFPYWKDPYAPQKEMNKEYLEIAMEELNKKADIFFIDELGDRQLFSEELQSKILEKMNDPSCVVIASIQKDSPQLDSKHFDFTSYLKQMESSEVYQTDNYEKGQAAKEKMISYMNDLPSQVSMRYVDMNKKVDFYARNREKGEKQWGQYQDEEADMKK